MGNKYKLREYLSLQYLRDDVIEHPYNSCQYPISPEDKTLHFHFKYSSLNRNCTRGNYFQTLCVSSVMPCILRIMKD